MSRSIPRRGFGATLALAFAGALLGGAVLLCLAAAFGALVLFLLPAYDLVLAAAAMIATFVTAVLARAFRFPASMILFAAALLTVALALAVPLAAALRNPNAAGGPLFG